MPFQVIVREIKQRIDLGAAVGNNSQTSEQIYEQNVEALDLSKVIAAVNFKPRVRKPRTPAASAPRS